MKLEKIILPMIIPIILGINSCSKQNYEFQKKDPINYTPLRLQPRKTIQNNMDYTPLRLQPIKKPNIY